MENLQCSVVACNRDKEYITEDVNSELRSEGWVGILWNIIGEHLYPQYRGKGENLKIFFLNKARNEG